MLEDWYLWSEWVHEHLGTVKTGCNVVFLFFFLNQYSLYTQCFKTCSFLLWPLVYSFLEVFCPASVTVAVQSPRLLVFSVWCLLVNENQKPRTRKLGGLVAVLKASSVSSLLYMATELGYSVFKGVSN